MLSPKESQTPPKGDATGYQTNFGTGYNKHPVAFSNNQHTPSTTPPPRRPSIRGNSSTLPGFSSLSRPLFLDLGCSGLPRTPSTPFPVVSIRGSGRPAGVSLSTL